MMDRRRQELELVEKQFGPLTVSPNLDWFIIEGFPLPKDRYNRSEVRLLHIMGPAYPQTPPDNFHVPAGLRKVNGQLPGQGYSEGFSHLGETWGTFSWHAQQWNSKPQVLDGDNLVTFLFSVQKRLAEETP